MIEAPDGFDPLPYTSEALIKGLDEAIPHRCIRPGESQEEAHRYAGKRELIDFLLQWQEDTAEHARQAAQAPN